MSDTLTIKHALDKRSIPGLKDIAENVPGEKIDPKMGKDAMVNALANVIPEDQSRRIIDEAFNKPKTTFNGHLGIINFDIPDEQKINEGIDKFNKEHGYDSEVPEFKKNEREELELLEYSDEFLKLHYTVTIKKLEYDFDTMESKKVTYAKKIRIIISPRNKKVSVFTGDRDIFNDALTALTLVMSNSIVPLDAIKTGITDQYQGGFTKHTVKVLDFLYFGLKELGTVGEIYQIDLDENKKKGQPQKVKVQGDKLLEDKSICNYLYLENRDLVGFKLTFIFNINNVDYKAYVEIGIRHQRVKLSIRKDNHTMERLEEFYELLEEVTLENLNRPVVKDEEGTSRVMEKIRDKVTQANQEQK